MAANWGNVPLNSVIPFFFDAFDGGTGASITLSGIATSDIEVYKGTSMTQRSSDNGYTLLDTDGIDVDGITGIHGFSIDTSDNTDAGFYVAGSFYTVVVSSVTIDAQTVNFIAGRFRLTPVESVAGVQEVDVTHWLGTAPNALVSNRVDASVGAMAANVLTATAINADAFTAAKFAADVSTEFNAAVLAVLGALNDAAADGDVTTTDTMVAYLKQIVNTLVTTVGIPTFPSSAAPANGVSLAEVIRQIYDEVAGLNGGALLDAAGVRGAVGLAAANLDTQLDAIPTSAENADAVWDEDATGHQTQGSFGQAIGDPAADAETIYGAVVTGAAGANIAVDIAAIEAQTDDIGVAGAGLTAIPWNSSWDAEVQSEVQDALDAAVSEPGQGNPAANASLAQKISYLYKAWRNRHTQTATEYALYADDTTTKDQEAVVSDDGTTFERGEVSTGA